MAGCEEKAKEKVPLLCVVGPTASGKTALAVELALLFRGEVISADSMQIYKGMDVGTAKPTQAERKGVPHHCLSVVEPGTAFSVAEYVALAREIIQAVHSRGSLPILAGGTGLYVNSLCDHIQFDLGEGRPASDPELRKQLAQEAELHGNQALWERLRGVDPELAQRLHPNNLGRVIRAIEVYQLTGITMSEQQRRSRLMESPYRLCMLGLDFRDRQRLYDRINRRVDQMLQNGLLDEVERLRVQGYSQTAGQAIGYKELFRWMDGEIPLEDALEQVRRESRRYAKRQLTWFRRDQRVRWLCHEDYPDSHTLLAAAAGVVQETLGAAAELSGPGISG